MEIQENQQGSILILHVDGQVDSTTSPVLSDKLDALIEQKHVHLVIDLKNVPYMSSAGLRALSIALKAVRAPGVGGDMCLAGLSKTVAHAFRISGFNQVFNIYDTVPEAIAVLAASQETDQI